MSIIDQTIFAGSKTYVRFCFVTEVLGQFVSASSRGLSSDGLAGETGRPVKELGKLCASLSRCGLIKAHASRPGIWVLARDACLLTLEDVFRFVLEEQAARCISTRARHQPPNERTLPKDIDLLLSQAAMAIDQSVFKHLRQFSLDRLKATGAAPSGRADAGLQGWITATAYC